MLLAADGNLADLYFWPLVALVTPAVLTLTLFLSSRWSARNKDAREVHRAVTSGAGADARSGFSDAEFDWWKYGRSPSRKEPKGAIGHLRRAGCRLGGTADTQGSDREEQETVKIDPELFKNFYVVDASLAQLTLVLNQYSKRNYWCGQSQRYRQLLGWHVGIHIAWVMWFVSVTCETTSDGEAGKSRHTPAVRLDGAWQRAKEALSLVGDYGIERRDAGGKDQTVKGFVAAELRQWVKSAEKGTRANASEIAAVKTMALNEVSEPTTEA